MAVFNVDLEDGQPPVSFVLNLRDAERFQRFMAECNAVEAEREKLRAALLQCARMAEALKRDCGMDPESGQAVRNSQYQAISTAAHIALGTIKGPVSKPPGRCELGEALCNCGGDVPAIRYGCANWRCV